MRTYHWIIGAIILAQLPLCAGAADSTDTNRDADIEALKAQIRVLSQKVQALEDDRGYGATSNAPVQKLAQKAGIPERGRQVDQADAAALAKTQPKITMGASGFSFSSVDAGFIASLHGLIQLDSRTFLVGHAVNNANDGFLLRRARPIFTGTVFHDFDFNFTTDFGGSSVQILDAYLNYHYEPAWQLEVGKFKSPVGLEQLQSDPWTSFNERSLVTDLVPNRDLGLELHGDWFGGALSYAAGIFNGAPDYIGATANVDSDDNKAFAGRLFAQPWKTSPVNALKGLGFGVGGSYESDRNGTAANSGLTSGYKTDGQQIFFSYNTTAPVTTAGTHWRISPQGYYCYGPFSLLGEYVISDQKLSGGTVTGKTPVELQNRAWEISAGWVLTGEDASYNGVTPARPFNLHSGGLGAWQVVARYAELDVDDNAFKDGFAAAGSANEARAWSVGLNWYLNRNIRINTSFSHTTFALFNGASTTVTQQPEDVFFTRVQLAF